MKKMGITLGVFLATSISHAAKSMDLNCSVVAVGEANNTVLEEGLGSIYDISDDGYIESDSDSTGASISISRNKIQLSLGQGSWNQSSSKMIVKSFGYELDSTSKRAEGIEIRIKTDIGTQVWRIFPELKIARINFSGGEFKDAHLATIDCSGVKDVRSR